MIDRAVIQPREGGREWENRWYHGILRNFLAHRDRRQIYVAEVSIRGTDENRGEATSKETWMKKVVLGVFFLTCFLFPLFSEEEGYHFKSKEAEEFIAQGNRYFDGDGVPASIDNAQRSWRKAAQTGDPEAQCFLAWKLHIGVIGGEDPDRREKEALGWYRKAAEQGHPPAQTVMGKAYEDGDVYKEDLKTAFEWYKRAADQGDEEAQERLGSWFYYQMSSPLTPEQGLAFLMKSVASGSPESLFHLGKLYQEGRGVPKSEEEACQCFRKAAEKGNSLAQLSLAHAYFEGKGVSTDGKEGLVWLRKAAENQQPVARFELGQRLATGDGVPKDLPRAYHLLLLRDGLADEFMSEDFQRRRETLIKSIESQLEPGEKERIQKEIDQRSSF